MSDHADIYGLAICAGVAGFELGIELVFGSRYRCIGYVEREAACAAQLVAHMEAGRLAPAPVWSDVRTFNGRRYRGVVDLVTAGFPCQPHSVAGKQRGTADERWIWPAIAECIREVRPAVVFLENVPAIVASGFGDVLGALAACGFDAEWDCVTAAQVGASQGRERLFILAVSDRGRFAELCAAFHDYRDHALRDDVDRCRDALAGGDSQRLADGELGGESGAARSHNSDRAATAELRRASLAELPLFPPRPGALAEWRDVLEIDGTVKPAIRGMAHGMAGRVDRIRALGNGVVPLQAAYAFCTLAARFEA